LNGRGIPSVHPDLNAVGECWVQNAVEGLGRDCHHVARTWMDWVVNASRPKPGSTWGLLHFHSNEYFCSVASASLAVKCLAAMTDDVPGNRAWDECDLKIKVEIWVASGDVRVVVITTTEPVRIPYLDSGRYRSSRYLEVLGELPIGVYVCVVVDWCSHALGTIDSRYGVKVFSPAFFQVRKRVDAFNYEAEGYDCLSRGEVRTDAYKRD
jgi:hypothetical protein